MAPGDRLHDLIKLPRFSPEDVETTAFALAAVARRHALTSVLPCCRDAVTAARAAVALAARYEVQQAALNQRNKRLRPKIARDQRITAAHVKHQVQLAREHLYLGLLTGLLRAKGPGRYAVETELWKTFQRTGSQRLVRGAEEKEALLATPPRPSGPGDTQEDAWLDQVPGPPAVMLRPLRTWWRPEVIELLAPDGSPAR